MKKIMFEIHVNNIFNDIKNKKNKKHLNIFTYSESHKPYICSTNVLYICYKFLVLMQKLKKKKIKLYLTLIHVKQYF